MLLDAFGALIDGKPLICGGRDEDFYTTKVHTDILKIFKLFFCTLWQAYCSICLCFLLHRHLPAKPALNSKQSAKGYERIIQEILRRCGYLSPKECQFFQHFAVIFLHDSFLKKKIDGLYLLCYPNIWVGAVGSC